MPPARASLPSSVIYLTVNSLLFDPETVALITEPPPKLGIGLDQYHDRLGTPFFSTPTAFLAGECTS
jgi:hypothetical protein